MSSKQQHQEPVDQLYFDGSAEPNPGGRMGAGWRLVRWFITQVFLDHELYRWQFLHLTALYSISLNSG